MNIPGKTYTKTLCGFDKLFVQGWSMLSLLILWLITNLDIRLLNVLYRSTVDSDLLILI